MKISKTGVIFRIALIALSVYLVYNIFSLRTQIRDKQDRLETLNQQVDDIRLDNEQMQNNNSNVLTNEEIEEVAREKLGYAYPNERIFVDITGK